MKTFTSILTSQDESRMFKMDSIIGLITSGDMLRLYIVLSNGNQYCIGEFNSKEKLKMIMECVWYSIDADTSYTVPKED